MRVIIRDVAGYPGWKQVAAGDFGVHVTVRATGLLMLPTWLTGAFSPKHVADLMDVLEVARAIAEGDQSTCAHCGDVIVCTRKDLPWYHPASGLPDCYREPEHAETATPERKYTHG